MHNINLSALVCENSALGVRSNLETGGGMGPIVLLPQATIHVVFISFEILQFLVQGSSSVLIKCQIDTFKEINIIIFFCGRFKVLLRTNFAETITYGNERGHLIGLSKLKLFPQVCRRSGDPVSPVGESC